MAFVPVLDERILLRHGAEVDAFAEVIHVLEVLAPALVDDLEDHVALDLPRDLVAPRLRAFRVLLLRGLGEVVDERLAGQLGDVLANLLLGDVGAEEVVRRLDELGDVPLLDEFLGRVLRDQSFDDLVDPALDVLGEVVAFEDTTALLVDDLALDVEDVVVLEDVLPHDEVLLLDLLLRVLDLLREDRRLHGLVVRELEALHDVVDPITGEQADDLILAGEVIAGLAVVALAARAAAQLVVDAARLVALSAEDVEAAEIADAFAELDVDATAGHVRRDRDGADLAGVLDDLGLALVLLRVQDVVRDAAALEPLRQMFGGLDVDRADENGLAGLVALDDVLDDGVELRVLRLEDQVVLVLAHNRDVGRNLDHVEAVDLDELLLLGLGGTGHAGELLVETEVVLERDRRESDVLLLNPLALLLVEGVVEPGLLRLVDALGRHALAPGAFHGLHDAGEVVVDLRGDLGLAGDDERRPGLVDQDRVDLVDNRVRVSALDCPLERDGHVVAEIVETELRVRPVGDVRVVRALALGERHHVLDVAHLHPEGVPDRLRPLGVSLGEVVVDGDQVDVRARQRVQVQRHRRDERLSLTGLHLGDVALVERDPAHQLDVEEPHVHRPLERLADGGIRLEEDVLGRLAVLDPLAELGRLRGEIGALELLFQRTDVGRLLAQSLQSPAFADAEEFLEVAEVRRHRPRVSESRSPTLSAYYSFTKGLPRRPRVCRRAARRSERNLREPRHRAARARGCSPTPVARRRAACAHRPAQ